MAIVSGLIRCARAVPRNGRSRGRNAARGGTLFWRGGVFPR